MERILQSNLEEIFFMDESFRKILNDFIDEYSQKIYPIPNIQDIQLISDDKIGGCFHANDLYNRKYILYLNENYMQRDTISLKPLLFHELTHLYDSIELSKYDYNKYLYLMQIYSEVHASEIEMNVMLENIEDIDVNTIIPRHNMSIYQYLMYELKIVGNEFILTDGPILKDQLKLEHKTLYYFIGYLRSIKNHQIECEIKYNPKIPSQLLEVMNKITDYYLNNNLVDYEILYSYEDEFIRITKEIIIKHREQYN